LRRAFRNSSDWAIGFLAKLELRVDLRKVYRYFIGGLLFQNGFQIVRNIFVLGLSVGSDAGGEDE